MQLWMTISIEQMVCLGLILRGHLAALEREMNDTLEEDVHMWNSALVETFMAHNNSISGIGKACACYICVGKPKEEGYFL